MYIYVRYFFRNFLGLSESGKEIYLMVKDEMYVIYLIEERESLCFGDPTLLQGHHPHRRSDQHSLPIELVQKDHPLHMLQPVQQ